MTRAVERAEGNALLAVETARALRDGNQQVASNLRGSVRATVASVPGEVRRLLDVVAVAARPLEPVETDRLSIEDAVVAEALQTGLLDGADGRLAFRHALLRDAAYAEISEPRRRTLHRAWARALLDAEQAGALAADEAGTPSAAGRRGQRRRGPARLRRQPTHVLRPPLEQAVGYLEEALTIAPDRPDLWLELGELEAWRGGASRPRRPSSGHSGCWLRPSRSPRAWLRRARAYHGPICVPRAVLESATEARALLGRDPRGGGRGASEAPAARAWAEAVAGRWRAERLLAELSAKQPPRDDLRSTTSTTRGRSC